MPTKSAAKRSKYKRYYAEKKEEYVGRASKHYQEHKETHREAARQQWLSDSGQRRLHRKAVKQCLAVSEEYRLRNRRIAYLSTTARLATDKEYKKQNRQRAYTNTTRRLASNNHYKQLNRDRAHVNTRRRLATDENYRKRNRQRAQVRMKKTLADISKRMEYCKRMRNRYQTNSKYRQSKKDRSAESRARMRASATTSRRVLTKQQKYWVRRSRLLAAGRHLEGQVKQQQQMCLKSNIRLFDVKLLFNKAKRCISRTQMRQKLLHRKFVEKVQQFLQKLPNDRSATEDDITLAFGERRHTSTSELYFWEQSYQTVHTDDSVPIDEYGRAHYFRYFTVSKMSLDNTDSLVTQDVTHLPQNVHSSTQCWQCNPMICLIQQDTIDGVVSLLQKACSVKRGNCSSFYLSVDQCGNPTRSNALGHAVFCQLSANCSSLLRPLRILSCHFPSIRTLLSQVYQMRRLSILINNIRISMQSGSYSRLRAAINELTDVLLKTDDNQSLHTSTTNTDPESARCVDERKVMAEFGSALREVVDRRDTYVTRACDVCEQLRSDIRSLKDYENRKGFSSDKMTQVIELLYQSKTQHEDLDEFLESMMICTYCADKLRSGNNVARSAFNMLSVIETPSCIRDLNLFELTLIKFCMTCLTIIRLGQITNSGRPRTELNAALKGRIAYLPVDVNANAHFLPDKLLNVDSLVLLVGGQPTKSKRVWASVVDLRKVHAALAWLRENNPLYKDVPAYSVDDLEKIIERRLSLSACPTSTTAEPLLRKLSEAAQSHLYESFTVQPISSEFPADSLVDYQFDKVQGPSRNVFDTDLDLKAYPELFPTGCNGMRDASRIVKIGTSDFLKSRLLNKDPKFRLNLNYLFHCFQVQEVSNMSHSVGHMLRTVTGGSMSAREFSSRLKAGDGEIQSKMFSLLANNRGTREYFAKLGMEVRWMIRMLGPPTLFVTCSAAEWFSEALVSHLRTVNASVAGVDKMSPAELCALDPVTVSVHFQKKWSAIFDKLITAKKTPLFGEVADYFWRIEYQSRGAPHVHCLLWIKDAPVIGRDSPDAVRSYIDKVITCNKPDPAVSPTLSELVSRFQQHRCNKYCQKTFKKNGKFYKRCRFGFPRPARRETQLNDVIDCLAVDLRKRPRRRLYHLQRTSAEEMINDFNPALLLANEANVDVQFIGHVGSRLSYYVTDYMSKYERCEQDEMWSDIYSSVKSLGSNAMSFLLNCVKSRQVGAIEAADRLLGHKLYRISRQTRFADLQPASMVKRVLKPAAEIERILQENPDSEDIFHPHWVLDIYPNRPNCLDNSSLHNVMAWYDRQPAGDEHLKVNGFLLYLRRRRQPYLVTHQLINPNQSDEHREHYFNNLLKLFVPWRNMAELSVPGKTSEEFFHTMTEQYPDMARYHQQFTHHEKTQQDLDDTVRQRAQQLNNADVEPDDDDEEAAMQGCVVEQMETAMNDVREAYINCTTNTSNCDAKEAYQSLNTDQKRVVDTVVNAVCNDDKPIHMIVSGQGGTGKSRVIDVVTQKVSTHFGNSFVAVATSAPTGLAAWAVGGTTIHRILNLPIEHGKPPNYQRLNQDQLNTMRKTLKGVKLLIIDEISMVSSLSLMFIHLRLTEIMSRNDLFGGVSILGLGDFLQLPPVKGNQPFIPLTALETKQRLGSVASFDLWQTFTYDELTVNMRQTGDNSYANLLSNIRTGQVTPDAHKLLSSRLIVSNRRASVDEVCNLYSQLVDDGKEPIILMPRTSLCNSINAAMLAKLRNPTVKLPAIDTLDTVVEKRLLPKVQKAYQRLQDDVTRTAGLESSLELALGARVMLKRNKNVEIGLVNGSVGTVTGFVECNNNISAVKVQFDKLPGTIAIQRDSVSFEVLRCIFYTRKQFPLMPAFSITIHKAQGLSLKSAIIDAGPNCFGPGMVYVALSRVTTLAGLHLIDFDSSKVTCDRKAIKEYNRLRKKFMPILGELTLSISVPTGRKRKQSQKPENSEDHNCVSSDSSNTNNTAHLRSSVDDCVPSKCSKRVKVSSSDVEPAAGYRKGRVRTKQRSTTSCDQPTTSEVVIQHSQDNDYRLWQYCRLSSVDETFQTTTCERLNLQLCPHLLNTKASLRPDVAQRMQSEIWKQTRQHALVKVFKVSGIGGNCLFRALSLAVTRSENQHSFVRAYIVNHLQHSDICAQLREMYARSDAEYNDHLQLMQNEGEWGTDLEIAAAAHLFQCYVICYQQYGSGSDYTFQHFPPHYAITRDCNQNCKHNETIYLVNVSGSHYDLATVAVSPPLEE